MCVVSLIDCIVYVTKHGIVERVPCTSRAAAVTLYMAMCSELTHRGMLHAVSAIYN
jgi:hypothetical protein